MMTINEQLLYCTVRIQSRSYRRTSFGTGFFLRHGDNDYLVTNRHVIEGTDSGTLYLHRKSHGRESGLAFEVPKEIWNTWWSFHPDKRIDVAVASKNVLDSIIRDVEPKGIFCTYLCSSMEPPVNALDAIEDITFIGYPDALWDEKHYLPITRRGHTASNYNVDFNGKPMFLIDAPVFPGSSGSPVVLHQDSWIDQSGCRHMAEPRIFFLGIIHATPKRTPQKRTNDLTPRHPVELKNKIRSQKLKLKSTRNDLKTLTAQVAQLEQKISALEAEPLIDLDLGYVFKPSAIIEAIEALNARRRLSA